MNKKVISIFMSLLMVVGMLPFGEMMAYGAEDAYIDITRIVHNQIIEENEGTVTSRKELEINGAFVNSKITGLIIYRKSDNGFETIINSTNGEQEYNVVNNKLNVDLADLTLEPGENLYPRVYYEYEDESVPGGIVKTDTWKKKLETDHNEDPSQIDPTVLDEKIGITIGTILSMNKINEIYETYRNSETKRSEIERSGDLKFDIKTNPRPTDQTYSEKIDVRLKDATSELALDVGDISIVSNTTEYNINTKIPENTSLGSNEIIVRNNTKGEATSKIIYRSIDVKASDPELFPFETDRIGPEGSVEGSVEGSDNQVLVDVKGKNITVDFDPSGSLIAPNLYLVPSKIVGGYDLKKNSGVLSAHEESPATLSEYKASIRDVYSGATEIQDVSQVGDRLVVEFPNHDKAGVRDLVLITPDKRVARLSDAFEYKVRVGSNPQITDLSENYISKADLEDSKTVVMSGKNIPVDKDRVTVTVEGKVAEIVDVRSNDLDISEQEVEFIPPIEHFRAEEKTVQLITKNTDGTKAGLTSYNWNRFGEPNSEGKEVDPEDSSNKIDPDGIFEYIEDDGTEVTITSVRPSEFSPGMEVIIKGSGFKAGASVWIEGLEGTSIITGSDISTDGTTIKLKIPTIEDQEDPNNNILRMSVGDKKLGIVNEDKSSSDKVEVKYREPLGIIDPTITEIVPSYTTKDKESTKVTVKGSGFKDGIYFMFGTEIIEPDRIRDSGTKADLIIPKYEYKLDEDTDGQGNVEVKVKAVNSDGGSSKEDISFYYRDLVLEPQITEVKNMETGDDTGTTLGGDKVRIRVGPFLKLTGVDPDDESDDILPDIYFGGEKAEIIDVDWLPTSDTTDDGKVLRAAEIYVKTPSYSKAERVDVEVVNPEAVAGIGVKEDGFEYKQSEPSISNVYPKTIPLNGKETIFIEGTGFMKSDYGTQVGTAVDDDDIDMEIEVLFGQEEVPAEIVPGTTKLDTDSFTVEYSSSPDADGNNIVIRKKEGFGLGEAAFTGKVENNSSLFVSMRTSQRADISEGLKISRQDDTLTLRRQMSIDAKVKENGTLLEVVTPPMLRLEENTSLTVINKDGGSAKWTGGLAVKNPASDPQILDIDENSKKDRVDQDGDVIAYAVESALGGGRQFSILVTEFIDGATISIGDDSYQQTTEESLQKGQYRVTSRQGQSAWIAISPLEGSEALIDRHLSIIVENPDGGMANSLTDMTVGSPPLSAFFVYKESTSSIDITEIDPDEGSAEGGQEVTITGSGFRPDEVKVWFGNNLAEIDTSKDQTTIEINVITPSSDVYGIVPVVVENESEFGQSNALDYTYTSAPIILEVNPDIVYANGGEEVQIIGKGFQEGATVIIGDQEVEVEYIDNFTLGIISPEVVLPNGIDQVKKDVTVINEDGGQTTKTNGITFTRPFPMRPTGFEATARDGRLIELKWDALEVIDRYRIEVSQDENGPYNYLAEVSDDMYMVRDLDPDKEYFFRLYAINEYGRSENYASADTETLSNEDDNQSGDFEDDTATESQVTYSGGSLNINYSKAYTTEDYTHDLTSSKYRNAKKITLNIPASVINDGRGRILLKHYDIELEGAISMLKSSERAYSDRDTLRIEIRKMFDGEQSEAARRLPSPYRTLDTGIQIRYSLGDGTYESRLDSIGGVQLTALVESGLLGDTAIYRYNRGDSSAVRENSYSRRQYSSIHGREIYKIRANIKRSGYYIPSGR